jgi:hypothetical protein
MCPDEGYEDYEGVEEWEQILTVREYNQIGGVSRGPVLQNVSRGVVYAMGERLAANVNLFQGIFSEGRTNVYIL